MFTGRLLTIDGKMICHVTCKASKTEVWLKGEKNAPERFYIRVGPSSKELRPKGAVAYIKSHFNQ